MFSFVFVEVHLADDVVDDRLGEALGDQVAAGEALLDVAFQNCVEDVVGRETVLVDLAGAEFGARGFLDRVERNDFAAGSGRGGGVDPPGQGEDLGFEYVTDHGETAAHVAVECAIAHGHFALVAGGEEEGAKFIGERHHEDAADAGLDIFLGDVGCAAGEDGPERRLGGGHGVGDGDGLEPEPEVFGEEARVVAGMLRRD